VKYLLVLTNVQLEEFVVVELVNVILVGVEQIVVPEFVQMIVQTMESA